MVHFRVHVKVKVKVQIYFCCFHLELPIFSSAFLTNFPKNDEIFLHEEPKQLAAAFAIFFS